MFYAHGSADPAEIPAFVEHWVEEQTRERLPVRDGWGQ